MEVLVIKKQKDFRLRNSWKTKAKEHFESGVILFEKGNYRDSMSRLYYSAYSLMVAELGEPPKGRWEHKGIIKYFFKRLHETNRTEFLTKEERTLINDFYEERRKADYTTGRIDKYRVQDYINLMRKLFEVLGND